VASQPARHPACLISPSQSVAAGRMHIREEKTEDSNACVPAWNREAGGKRVKEAAGRTPGVAIEDRATEAPPQVVRRRYIAVQ